MAAEFGRDFPKIAGRLSLSADGKVQCPDPYVERLLEGFAFLAARVHLKLDAEFPRFTQGLLETVYPDYLCPVPSMAIVQFEPDVQEGALAAGFRVQRVALCCAASWGRGSAPPAPSATAQDVRLLATAVTDARYYRPRLAELNLPREMGAKAAIRFACERTIPEAVQADSGGPAGVSHPRRR